MDGGRLDDLEGRSWQALLTAHWRVTSRLEAELQATLKMSIAEYAVLMQLSRAANGMRMSELAEQLQLSPSGLTRRVDRLVTMGLVHRRRCATDGRGSYAILTAAGRRKLASTAPYHDEQVRRHFAAHLNRRELALLAEVLEKVATGQHSSGATEKPRRPL